MTSRKKFNLMAIVLSIVLAFTLFGCDSVSTAEDEQEIKTNQSLNQSNKTLGMPNIVNFNAKRTLKRIYEMQDDAKLVCYAYMQAIDGKFVYIGKTMGYAVPYSTQYTNPEKEIYSNGVATIAQADPDGLYHSSSTSATWIILIDEETGKTAPMYCEPNMVVYPFKLPTRVCASWSLPTDY
jgi:hypothetical protein